MQNLNLNTFPFYDDFSAEKGFHKILFKPGVAVQARELTQIQSILQNQIKAFGNNIFTDGTVIFGCPESTNFNAAFVKVLDTFSVPSGQSLDNTSITAFEGLTLRGANQSVTALIKKAVPGSNAGPQKTFYLQYTATGVDNTTTTFAPNELVTVVETGQVIIIADSPTIPTGFGSLFSVGDGIVYAKGNFVVHSGQTIVVEPYNTTPTKKVGFIINEAIITSDDDQTLLDPAQGSFNYTAPGADRYHLSTILTAYGPSDVVPQEFYILFDIASGTIKRRYNTTQYGELNKTLARRMYDQSGDYTVRAFPLIIQEHLDTGTNNGRYTAGNGGNAGELAINVQPGKAYVKGFEQELFATEYLAIDKGVGFETKINDPISTAYGYYVTVNAITGAWPINSDATVVLSGGALAGTARVREVEYASATTYNIYLYDMEVAAGSLSSLTTLTYAAGNAVATVVSATIFNSTNTAAIFPSPYMSLKTFANASYVYRKIFLGVAVVGGAATVAISGTETFAFSSTTNPNDIYIEKAGSPYTIETFASASVSTSNLNISGISGSPGTVNISVLVQNTIAANTKTLHTDQYVVLETPLDSTRPYPLGYSDVFAIQEVWVANSSAAYPVDHPSLITDPNWVQTIDYTFDNGQRDGLYDTATITPGSSWGGSWLTKKVIILLTYFEHGTASPYYTVDSYPVPAVNVAPILGAEIEWYQIPNYISSTGTTFSLRDCIDFRPTTNLSNLFPCTTISYASTTGKKNPVAATTFVPGFVNPVPQEEFLANVSYFLPRIDRIVVDTEGNFTTVTGVSSSNPVYPREPDNAMTLGYVSVAPYPSLSPFMAKLVEMPQYACSVTQIDNRRYTMRDIGNIGRRINRLEYYTSLSMLEQSTANMMIRNNSGLDRFKNGILVDAFTGHNIGNVSDPAYKCSIGGGELHPFFNMDNLDLQFSSGSVVRKATDAIIVVRQSLVSADYVLGTTVTNGVGASGTVLHTVLLGTGNGWKWVRLYLNGVTGAFSSGNTIGSGTITAIDLGIMQSDVRPDLVVIPTDGNLATLPYTHNIYAQNPYASKTRNVVSQILFTYTGTMALTPPSDVWTDTSILPEVQVNVNGENDNYTTIPSAWGTQWGAWETVWQGIESVSHVTGVVNVNSVQQATTSETTDTTVQRQIRRGTVVVPAISTTTQDQGTRVVSTDVIPYMRSVLINFSASGLKPNTTVYPFFDGVNVSANCRKTTFSFGTPLTINIDGTLTGDFLIPPGKFTTGTKNFVICDSSTGSLTNVNTIASAAFTASGQMVVEQDTILSTQTVSATISQQTETQDVTIARQTSQDTTIMNRVIDPIAQTFFVSGSPNGVLLTKLDLYFQTKSSTAPMMIQIREVINGYPGEAVVPYSTVTLNPKDINTSQDGTAVTEFKFNSPVYLKNDMEYCFVLLPVGNDENYNLWVSELGANVIGTTERIDKQPYAGVLFVSANNNTWTAIQSEDVKFTLYQALFTPNTPATAVLVQVPLDYVTITNNQTSFKVGDAVSFWDNTPAQVATGIIKYYNPLRGVAQITRLTGSILTAITIQNATTDASASYLDFPVDAISPTIGHLDFNNTDVVWVYQLQGGVATSLSVTGTTYLRDSSVIRCVSDSGAGDLTITATLSTTVKNISPVLDVSRGGCVVVSNYISLTTTNEGNAASGGAKSKYITRRVILDNGYEAEDLQVYVTADIPSTSNVLVYAKLLNETDPTLFDNRPWTLMTTAGVMIPGPTEYLFEIPVATGTETNTLTGALDSSTKIFSYSTDGGVSLHYTGFKVFAVKIVLIGSNTSQPPVVTNMRAIALMV